MFKLSLIGVLFFIVAISSISYGQEVPFTLQDRERIIRLEAKFEQVHQHSDDFDTNFSSLNQSINDLRDEMRKMKILMLWGFVIIFIEIVSAIIIILWDRKTVISPILQESQ